MFPKKISHRFISSSLPFCEWLRLSISHLHTQETGMFSFCVCGRAEAAGWEIVLSRMGLPKSLGIWFISNHMFSFFAHRSGFLCPCSFFSVLSASVLHDVSSFCTFHSFILFFVISLLFFYFTRVTPHRAEFTYCRAHVGRLVITG